jgi:PAS domain-containing protein
MRQKVRFYDESNKPIRILSIDATGENIQTQLVEREQKFRLLADSILQIVWTANPENLNYFNQAVFDYTGYSQTRNYRKRLYQLFTKKIGEKT